MKIGIIREGKIPEDSRVPLTPKQCRFILDKYDIELVVQPSKGRCYSDDEYLTEGVPMSEDMESCDVLLGVKEVPIDQLVEGKTCFFFSHTIKEQVYNRPLLQAIIEKNIRLIDYEVIKGDRGRVIAFGVFAGMVGAHNGIMTYGTRTGLFTLPRMNSFKQYVDAVDFYKAVDFPKMKIALTGTGRVGQGATKVLLDMGIRQVDSDAFLNESFDEAVFTQLDCYNYVCPKDKSKPFDKKEFYKHPERFESSFAPYTRRADILINGIYWDNNAPAFFSVDDMKKDDFAIQVVADVTCDIAPVSSIPSTLFASTIKEPIFGFDPETGKECTPFQPKSVDMMTVDNLPNELPRDASEAFGQMFLDHVFDELVNIENSDFLMRASVTYNRDLGPNFEYLRDYLNGAD